MATPPPEPLLSVRAAVIFSVSIMVGFVAGGLSYLAQLNVAAACLVAGGALAGAIILLNAVVARK